MNSTGQTDKAFGALAAAQKRQPNDRELLFALATMNRDAGRMVAARSYAERLAALAPDDPGTGKLYEQLKR